MSVQTVLAMTTVIVRENMEFHLNVNVHCREVYSRNAQRKNSWKRNPFAESESFLFPKSVGAVAIVNTCFGICAATKDLKKTRRKETYLFCIWYRQMDIVAVIAGCQKYDRRGWLDRRISARVIHNVAELIIYQKSKIFNVHEINIKREYNKE